MIIVGRRFVLFAALFLLSLGGMLLGPIADASAQVPAGVASESEMAAEHDRAPVTLDGEELFYVRGITAYPARERAKTISGQVRALAADRSVSPDSLRAVESDGRTSLVAPGYFVVWIFDADAEDEGIPRSILAEALRKKIVLAVETYREDRAPGALLTRSIYALAATVVALVLLLVTIRIFRSLYKLLEPRLTSRIEGLRVKSGDAIRIEPLWMLIRGLIATARVLTIIVIVYFYLNFALALYPWTRALSKQIFAVVLDPLRSMGAGLVGALPGLIFIAILVIIARYLLKAVRLFFAGIDQKRVAFAGFESEWAWPTYRIVYVLIIALTVVFAYPHIPGSDSGAFKGVSILLGVLVSLGSSSTIANVIAGYTLIYRRTFRIGDIVRINDIEGMVSERAMLVTHVRTIKNEDIVVPNSMILAGTVTNYSTLARTRGLILHTSVGIGYETSWRQVEAMLLLAAERTAGLLKDPPPFVLQKALGDFAVTYELNAYTDDPTGKVRLYAELHRNILDAFNEYGVQIMTPAYEGDPERPKTVPKDQWFSPPAKRPGSPGAK